MKKIILLLLLSSSTFLVHAQLTNTKWKGTLKLDNPLDAFFDFKNDTLFVTSVADSSTIEIMTYTANDSSFTIQKISGQSDCDGTTVGKYKFKIDNNGMNIVLISDDCDDRSSVLNNTNWIKAQ
ncbi:MAG: hypothetical protein ACR2FN_08650 [Chitinophagaceae bacterium]